MKIQSALYGDIELVLYRIQINDLGGTYRFDGDTCSFNGVYSDEAIDEIKKTFNSAAFYKDTAGKLTYSIDHSTLNLVVLSLTKADGPLKK